MSRYANIYDRSTGKLIKAKDRCTQWHVDNKDKIICACPGEVNGNVCGCTLVPEKRRNHGRLEYHYTRIVGGPKHIDGCPKDRGIKENEDDDPEKTDIVKIKDKKRRIIDWNRICGDDNRDIFPPPGGGSDDDDDDDNEGGRRKRYERKETRLSSLTSIVRNINESINIFEDIINPDDDDEDVRETTLADILLRKDTRKLYKDSSLNKKYMILWNPQQTDLHPLWDANIDPTKKKLTYILADERLDDDQSQPLYFKLNFKNQELFDKFKKYLDEVKQDAEIKYLVIAGEWHLYDSRKIMVYSTKILSTRSFGVFTK